MAKNTGHGSRYAAEMAREIRDTPGGMWIERGSSSGIFMRQKERGGSFGEVGFAERVRRWFGCG